jgi:hypothetical protein
MKTIKLFLIGIIASLSAMAQVPKKIIVEHFTNTYCSICASRNPGFFTNLSSHQDVLQLSIHPSAPYSQCYLNKQNKTENDARTTYYGVFGSTPRLVINGVAISASTNYNNASIFDPYKSQTSEISIEVKGRYVGDSVEVTTIIKAEVNNTIGEANLFVALANANVNYPAANGEQLHRNVFRKSLNGVSGALVSLPAMAGDSIVLISKARREDIWGANDLFAMAIINHASNKSLIQAAKSTIFSTANGLKDLQRVALTIYPNPVKDYLQLQMENTLGMQFKIYNLQGSLVMESNITSIESIDVSSLNQGLYFIELNSTDQVFTGRFIKQ